MSSTGTLCLSSSGLSIETRCKRVLWDKDAARYQMTGTPLNKELRDYVQEPLTDR